jgi:hypothetical protein
MRRQFTFLHHHPAFEGTTPSPFIALKDFFFRKLKILGNQLATFKSYSSYFKVRFKINFTTRLIGKMLHNIDNIHPLDYF